jgi:hypothetical protein
LNDFKTALAVKLINCLSHFGICLLLCQWLNLFDNNWLWVYGRSVGVTMKYLELVRLFVEQVSKRQL